MIDSPYEQRIYDKRKIPCSFPGFKKQAQGAYILWKEILQHVV